MVEAQSLQCPYAGSPRQELWEIDFPRNLRNLDGLKPKIGLD